MFVRIATRLLQMIEVMRKRVSYKGWRKEAKMRQIYRDNEICKSKLGHSGKRERLIRETDQRD